MGRNERSRHAGLLRFTRNTSMAAFSFREDNHSACAGWQGFGGGAYQQAFAEVINSALLATICLTLKGRGNALLRGSYLSYNEGESVLRSIA